MPGVPRLSFSCVDIEDVVQAHIKGLFVAEAANQRFVVMKQNVWLVDICKMIQAAVPIEYKDDIQVAEMDRCPIYLVSFFSAEA